MPVKDKVASWFIKNIVMPGSQIFNKPGFISMHITGLKSAVYLREIVIPEFFFVNLEKKIIEKLDKNGAKLLYSAGKKFGYQYAQSGGFPTINSVNQNLFEKFCYVLVRYTESTYANKIEHVLFYTKKRMDFLFDNFVICPSNGLGYFLMEGGVAGIWSFIVQDKSVEGLKLECQGRGDKLCKLIVAPKEELKKFSSSDLKTESILEDFESVSKYMGLNKFQVTQNSTVSFQKMLDTKTFSYKGGIIERNGARYFLCVSSAFFILEKVFSDSVSLKILFDVSFETGGMISKGEKKLSSFISQYLGALGWGDITLLKRVDGYHVFSSFFPFNEYSAESTFVVFRGLVSGIVSQITGEKYFFKTVKTSVSQGHLSVEISE